MFFIFLIEKSYLLKKKTKIWQKITLDKLDLEKLTEEWKPLVITKGISLKSKLMIIQIIQILSKRTFKFF